MTDPTLGHGHDDTVGPAFGTLATIYVCAAIGGVVATIADIAQKQDASAVMTLNSIAAQQLRLSLNPLYIVLGIIVLAILLSFVFQPRDRKTAFAIGTGVIAFIMTATPYETPPTGVAPAPIETGGLTAPGRDFAAIAPARLWHAGVAMAAEAGPVVVSLSNPSSLDVVADVSLYDWSAKQEYRQKAAVPAGATVDFSFAPRGFGPDDSFSYRLSIDGLPGPEADIVPAADGSRRADIDLTDALTSIYGAKAFAPGATARMPSTLDRLIGTFQTYSW